MIIRDARPVDAGALLDIYAWYVRHTAVSFEYEPPTLEAFRGRMAATTARYPWLVAEEDGRPLGYACAGPFKNRAAYDWSCETTIYLDGNARGRGIGRALYEALEAALGSMGVRNLYACIALYGTTASGCSPCPPMLFSIHTMSYHRPNLLAQERKVPTRR